MAVTLVGMGKRPLQRTPDEITAMIGLVRASAAALLANARNGTWADEGAEWERLTHIRAALEWARDPSNWPDDGPRDRDVIDALTRAAIADEGPFITPEREAEIRLQVRHDFDDLFTRWARWAPVAGWEVKAALRWLMGWDPPVGAQGYTATYRALSRQAQAS
jgi:hypothetical protein